MNYLFIYININNKQLEDLLSITIKAHFRYLPFKFKQVIIYLRKFNYPFQFFPLA